MRGGNFLVILTFVHLAKADAIDYETQIETCKLGDVVQNECLLCICTTKSIYKCTQKNCSPTYKEKFLNSVMSNESVRSTCRPSVVYATDRTTCICDKTGHWPHKQCEAVFQTLNKTNDSCEANSYVILDCNVCHCGENGRIDWKRCTKNVCEEVVPPPKTRRQTSNVYGSCEVKNWYSLAPCQFCFCIDQNKLVCNTGNYYAKKLDLGSYHLNVCGKGLIYEAIALLPDNDLTLRFGNTKLNSTVSTTPSVLTSSKFIKMQGKQNMFIDVNKGKEIEAFAKDNVKDKDSTTSESEEEKSETTMKVREVAITKLPYSEDGDDTSKENYYSDKKEPDSGMDIGYEEKPITPKVKTTPNIEKFPVKPNEQKSAETLKNIGQNLGKTLKMSIPQMLDQMFKIALRKSMLSLNKDTKCVPGTTQVVKCNMCFCMKNGKLLCTNNLCE